MKTFMLRKEDVQREWYVVDAAGKTLGRLASEIAKILIGSTSLPTLPMLTTVILSLLLTLKRFM